jgi:ATP-dependent Lon protease
MVDSKRPEDEIAIAEDSVRRSPPENEPSGTGIVPIKDLLPPHLLLLPVAQTTIFPGMIVPLVLPEGKLTKTIDSVMKGAGYVGIALFKNSDSATVATGPSTSMTGLPAEGTVYNAVDLPEGEDSDEFYRYGVAAKVLKKINLPDNQVSVLLTGLQRFEIKNLDSRDPHYVASVSYLYEEATPGTELEAMLRSALSQFKQISKDNPLISEEMRVALVNIDGPGKLADFMASVLVRDVADYQLLLASPDVKTRLQYLLVLLKKEQDVQSVQKRIQEEINQKISSAQREFYLQEQLKYIQRELGRDTDDRTKLAEKFKARLKNKKLGKEAKSRINEEMEKLETLPEQSSEYSVSLNYLDWATSLPWGVRSEEHYDLGKARQKLDADHYGLKDVKQRILEFLAVKKLKENSEGTILCLVGPPGTGKTSLGKSIAQTLGRKFFRFSVGGMRDEAEIKGHRRTYVGAMPGKLIQGLKRVGTQNPVFLIDEVDKIGTGAHSGGDPASALLELLDPEQNPEFLDHYLDIPFDCSDIFFITTANSTDTIPSALLDRMEVIYLRGYTDQEKFHIAQKYLIPKQLKKNALRASHLKLPDVGLRAIVSHYARESGVRNLEKQIAKICRKVAYKVALGRTKQIEVDSPKLIEQLLGLPPFTPEESLGDKIPGVATGLAWTQFGGEILYVESMAVPGKGGFTLTGSLGDVMKESGSLAYTYIRNQVGRLKLIEDFFEKNLLHVHVPAGAIPKDGPSAGVTMVASLYSLLSKTPVKPFIAMTGEITLTGRVLPVGGIKEKLLAAKRSQMKTVLLPKLNERDLRQIEPEVKEGLHFIKVATLDECIRHLFESSPRKSR